MLVEIHGVYGGDDILPAYPADIASVLYIRLDFAVEYAAAAPGAFGFSVNWAATGILVRFWRRCIGGRGRGGGCDFRDEVYLFGFVAGVPNVSIVSPLIAFEASWFNIFPSSSPSGVMFPLFSASSTISARNTLFVGVHRETEMPF